MATSTQIADVRRMADEPGTETYSDSAISALVDGSASLEAAAASIWQVKAGQYASLVDTSESGSSRKMSQLHSNALKMYEFYNNLANPTVDPVAETNFPFTVAIERT